MMMRRAPVENAAPSGAWPMYRALVGVGALSGLLIVSVFVGTLPLIERNEARALARAVYQVLPGAASQRSFALGEDQRFTPATGGEDPSRVIHAGYDSAGQLVGVAIPAQGMGYQDRIRLLYGYAPQRDAIVGMRVLASKETPGLGDRIESDPEFLANFRALDVTLRDDGQSLAHRIEAVKHGAKQHPWQIDGITGATISGLAVADILRQSSRYWVPLIHRARHDFTDVGDSDGKP